MSALFSLSCCPSLHNPKPALFFIPLCYVAVTHLLGQQMEQGKHSMSVLWCTHSFFLSLFLYLFPATLSLFFFWKHLNLEFSLGCLLNKHSTLFFSVVTIVMGLQAYRFYKPSCGETFPCSHCFTFNFLLLFFFFSLELFYFRVLISSVTLCHR